MNFNSISSRQIQLFDLLFPGSKNKRSPLEVQLRKNNLTADNRQDSFIRSSSVFAGTYTAIKNSAVRSVDKPLTVKSKYISQDILADINSGKYAIFIHGDIVECNGNRFRRDQIPPIDGTGLKEVQPAKNNVMDFGSNRYFKYISADGKEHLLYASEEGFIGSIASDDIRVGGAPHDETLQRYAYFWRYMMSKDPVYIGLEFTDEEIKAYLDEAGIKTGFFTVRMGNREATQFRTECKYCNVVESKERYDERYASLTSSPPLLYGYTPGDVFKVAGKEYVLSESLTLDIPYGEDIYDIEYPKNYWNEWLFRLL